MAVPTARRHTLPGGDMAGPSLPTSPLGTRTARAMGYGRSLSSGRLDARAPETQQARPPCATTPEAVALFRQGMRAPHDHAIRIAFAAALGRSKFSASPLVREPRSLLGCDREPVEFVL